MPKTYLFGAAGLVVGLVLGIALGRSILASPVPAATAVNVGSLPLASASVASTAAAQDIDTAGRPSRGPVDAKVTVVEFTDYQCPYCERNFQDTYPQVIRDYGTRIRYVVREMPLTIHPKAEKAAEAAECAYAQGKFWEYHDALFAHQAALEVSDLKTYAAALGLDTNAFASCLDSGAMAATVARDVSDAERYGVTGTPTFFINGQKLVGAVPYAQWRTLLDAALAH